MIRVTSMPQDDGREIAMRSVLRLSDSGEGREGSDAVDEFNNKYELKTTFKKDRGVSTARSVNFRHIARWREKHWIFALGNHYTDGFELTEYYYLSPQKMENWIMKVEDRLQERKRLSEYTIQCLNTQLTPVPILKKITTILTWGSKLNDPRIPIQYIKKNGVLLQHPVDEHLRNVIDTQVIVSELSPDLEIFMS